MASSTPTVFRRAWTVAVPVVIAVVTVGTLALTRVSGSDDGVREVTLRVKNMAFHLDGQDGENPTLRFAAGEKVRLVLINEDRGFRHNLVIPTLDVRTDIIDAGGRDTVTITVPASTGTHAYTCEPHAAMMRGNIAIE